MNITRTAVHRPIATAMVFLIIIVIGVMGFRFLPVDLLPPIEWPQLTVRTNYPNVGPEEIERIAAFLLGERGLHTTVKLNPTLLGPDLVRGLPEIDVPVAGVTGWLLQGRERQLVFLDILHLAAVMGFLLVGAWGLASRKRWTRIR